MDLSRIMNPTTPEEHAPPPPSHSIRALSPPLPSPEPKKKVPVKIADLTDDNELGKKPVLSFMAMEAIAEGKVTYVSPSAADVVGWTPEEAVGTPASLYCHPEDAPDLYRAYQEMISEDKAACLMYHRIPYKDTSKGHVLCSVTISRVGNHLIGACTPVTSMKAMHNSSTAQDVFVITPSAATLVFRRWNAPPVHESSLEGDSTSSRETSPPVQINPHPPSPEPKSNTEPDELIQSLRKLTLTAPTHPETVKRVAFVVDRFSINVPVIFATNDEIMPKSLVMGRSFYDFVMPGDETRVRQAMDMVKGWGVDESGFPSEGGFAFNRFKMCLNGRDSAADRAEQAPLRKRRSQKLGSATTATTTQTTSRNRTKSPRTHAERGINVSQKDTLLVDSIFSPSSDGIIVVLRPALQTGVTTINE